MWQKCISACPHYWQTNLGHKLPINNTNTGNSMYQKNFKTYSGYLLTYIYLLITVCAPLVLALNTIKMISKLLWLVIHGFPRNLQICLLHYMSENVNHKNDLLLFPAL